MHSKISVVKKHTLSLLKQFNNVYKATQDWQYGRLIGPQLGVNIYLLLRRKKRCLRPVDVE